MLRGYAGPSRASPAPASATSATLRSGTALRPPRPLPTFALQDQDTAPFGNARLRGKWSFVFFGFTSCGDICPTTLALLDSVNKSLADLPAARQPQVVFVGVDSARDTPAALKEYLRSFNPHFVGVAGPQAAIDALTAALGIPSAVRSLGAGSYAVDHSGALLLVNPAGELQALFSPPHAIDALAEDYRLLVGQQQ
jgi:protein SCO1